MLTLYGNLESGNVYKVRLLFAELGIAHRRIEVSQTRGEPRSPAYLAVNPIGKVPAVAFDDGRVLAESGAILYYFAQATPLWPGDVWDQADVLKWMFFEQYSHEPAIAVNRYILNYMDDPGPYLDRVRENHAKGMHALGVMERHLAGHDWLAAGRYTIADIALYAYTHNAGEAEFDLAEFPAIRAWLERVRARPGHLAQMTETSAERVRRLVP